MKFYFGTNALAQRPINCVATIGAFDGMHLGHQAVLKQVKLKATELNLPSTVILFEPQPKEFFSKESVAPRIMGLRDKLAFLQNFGLDIVLCLKFNKELTLLSAKAFVQKILLNSLQVKHLVIGDDFKFGKNRQGDFNSLIAFGEEFGFTVADTKTLLLGQSRVSSSQLRSALLQADFAMAKKLANHNYSITGRVIHGAKLGRKLGFPTINIKLKQNMVVSGVYKVLVHGLKTKPLTGAASVGTRPVLNDRQLLLEVYIFDYQQECYGKFVEVEFIKKIREEQDFASLEQLVMQIKKDIEIIKSQ